MDTSWSASRRDVKHCRVGGGSTVNNGRVGEGIVECAHRLLTSAEHDVVHVEHLTPYQTRGRRQGDVQAGVVDLVIGVPGPQVHSGDLRTCPVAPTWCLGPAQHHPWGSA